MPTFDYTAVDVRGSRVTGALAGASEQAVLAELESRKLTPVRVQEKKERPALRRGPSSRQLGQTYTQLADLLKAGVPLLRSLTLLSRRRSQPRLAGVFRTLAEEVSDGQELSDAMSRCNGVFPTIHIAMVRAGEKGGFLEDVFAQLGRFVLAQAETRSKIVGSLAYPAMLIAVGAVILGIIFGVFVPRFEPMFARLEERQSLPALTVVVLGISNVIAAYGIIVLAILGGLGVALWRLARRPDVRRAIAKVQISLPVVGPLTRAMATARFCRMLGTMEANGVPLLTAMQIARQAVGNPLMEEAIDRATESVRAGETLAAPLAQSGLFADDIVEMISVGEAAGNVDHVLLNIADTVEGRVERLLASAIRLVEPLLLVVLAVAIALVAAALILPMTQVTATI